MMLLQQQKKQIELSKEERRSKIEDLVELVAIHDTQTKDFTGTDEEIELQQNKNIEVKKKFQTIVAAHNALAEGSSVEDAVAILDPKKKDSVSTDDKVSAIEALVTHIGSSVDVSPAQVDKILGSQDFINNATPSQIKQVKTLDTLNKAKANLEEAFDTTTLKNVNDNILNGSENGKFLGITQHMSNMEQAIALNDREGAIKTIKAIGKLIKSQEKKLDKTNSPEFTAFVEAEVSALKAAFNQAKSMGIAAFTAKVKEEVKSVDPIVQQAKETDSIIDLEEPGYMKLLSRLEKIVLNVEVEDGGSIDIPAGLVLETIDTRLNGLTTIFKECTG